VRLLIKNGRLLDPGTKKDGMFDLLIEDGKILKVEAEIEEAAEEEIDAAGCFVMPGLIDIHVHLREPGYEYKETIRTGALAAAKGGFTTICPMPNTNPATDSKERIEWIADRAEKEAVVNVLPVGAITLRQDGEELTDIEGMAGAGAVGISEDGKSVMNAELYRRAMEAAAKNNLVVMAHCEDKNLVGKGVVNQGEKSKELGFPGISNSVEDVIIARDILLAKETGARLHLCHCSTKDSVLMVKSAKEHGLFVTAEVCPHHFAMSTDDLTADDSNYKMNPPLRSKADVQALKEGLRDDIMDIIATDHAPHGEEEKKQSILKAPFGIVGSETAVALTVTELLEKGYLTPMQMAQKMSYNPARVIGIDRGTLQEGKIADITVINPNEEYVIDKNSFVSKGKNTPFHGKTVRGKVVATIVNGIIVYRG